MFRLANEVLNYDVPTASFGMAWGDVDGDGDVDAWASEHGGLAVLLLNRIAEAGTFLAIEIGPRGDKHGAAWADLDGDGDQDLLQLRGGGRGGKVPKDITALGNQLFVNDGVDGAGLPRLAWPDDGRQESDSRGLYYSAGRGRTPTVLDVNLDGRLDVIVGNEAREDGAFPSTVFLQRRGGTFREAPDALGLDGNGVTLALPADFDGDGRMDLFLRSSVGANAVVYGTGRTFEDRGGPALPEAMRDVAHLTEDVLLGDFDNDGTTDVWLVGQGFARLFLNRDGAFVDVTAAAGLDGESFVTLNAAAGDFDNDGDLDAYLVNADYGSRTVGVNLPNTLWENTGTDADGVPVFRARQGAGFAPSDDNGLGWSVAVADVDDDGGLDLLVSNGAQGPRDPENLLVRGSYDLFLNSVDPDHAWLLVGLAGVVSNVEGIGAIVTATVAGRTQLRTATNGVHDKTQDDARLHFGFGPLDDAARITLEVRWPGGAVQRLGDIAPGQILRVTEFAGQAGGDTLTGAAAGEAMDGAGGGDALAGGDGADTLMGGAGRDTVAGGRGDDLIQDGPGRDVLSGGAGADRFQLTDPGGNADRIRDFTAGEDRILLSAAALGGGLQPSAPLMAAQLRPADATLEAGVGVVLFDAARTLLLWDGDGAGGAAAVRLAVLEGVGTLAVTDLSIVA